MYRYPKDDARTNLKFYQRDYQQGLTTEMPDLAELSRLLAANFRGMAKDLGVNVRIAKDQRENGRRLTHECSWGYGVHQFQRPGYGAIGFEISNPRAEYGRKHQLRGAFTTCKELLKPGGILVNFLPRTKTLGSWVFGRVSRLARSIVWLWMRGSLLTICR
jgi:hypothetical protein